MNEILKPEPVLVNWGPNTRFGSMVLVFWSVERAVNTTISHEDRGTGAGR
jgi:hypothetical protein